MHYLCPHCFSFLGTSCLLRFFDEFEAVYSQFNQAQLSTSLDNEQFLSLLKKLDDCKSYVATNPQVSTAGGHSGWGGAWQLQAQQVTRSGQYSCPVFLLCQLRS